MHNSILNSRGVGGFYGRLGLSDSAMKKILIHFHINEFTTVTKILEV